MSDLMKVFRAAMRPGMKTDVLDAIEGEPDAEASILETPPLEASTTGGDMSGNQTMAGAAPAATPAPAASAAASGSDGGSAALGRVSAVLGAEGIRGDAGRMGTAIELMTAAPGMSSEAVIAFVSAHVSAAGAAGGQPSADATPAVVAPAMTYEQRRVNAAALAAPLGASAAASGPRIDRAAIFASRRNATKGA